MAKITLKGQPTSTIGRLPTLNTKAPNFVLTQTNLSDVNLSTFKDKNIILSIFPSLDTPTCSRSVQKFNAKAAKFPNTQILCISADLPFAHARFCDTNAIKNITTLSCFRHPEFGKNYGVTITDGPLQGLLSRAIVVIDKNGIIKYTQQVEEIADEPNYELVLNALNA